MAISNCCNKLHTPLAEASANKKDTAITVVGLALITGAIVVWILIAQNQMAISQTQHKIHKLTEEFLDLDIDNFERISEIFNQWRQLTQQLDALRGFPSAILMPVASVATVLGVSLMGYGCMGKKSNEEAPLPQPAPDDAT